MLHRRDHLGDARIRGEAPRAGSLGDRLRQLRTRARLEVDELARCLGREISQVRAVEADAPITSRIFPPKPIPRST